jgi:hypothetical protein
MQQPGKAPARSRAGPAVVGRGESEADYMLASPVSEWYVFTEKFTPEKAYLLRRPTSNHYL